MLSTPIQQSTCEIPEAATDIHAAGIRNKYIRSGSVVTATWSTTAAGLVSGPLMLDSIPNTLSAFRNDVDFPLGDNFVHNNKKTSSTVAALHQQQLHMYVGLTYYPFIITANPVSYT